ncbi:phospholipid/glycerol acyltransferase [Thecamonas trahens ATCC 50062]|uniref:Tafazzin family protein n=1 Tax=Thecamonas trahens ATCC 50062 TaxID=461836 RepID=A0A0L0DV49_THETB|nr:phospholipid/glycerol acyltransferase [Thecamonas trahens ATCC 50062]KNC55966.1 phospholipid/glycerol acyltransferase [Thecamonas trahens ATCC 50062]|eukprot:XP_013761013.1 phospholipid/glycerol acyltransferase [Thecamonas trahens ATCC 50062]
MLSKLFSSLSLSFTTSALPAPHCPHAKPEKTYHDVVDVPGIHKLPSSDHNVGWSMLSTVSIATAWTLASIHCNGFVTPHVYNEKALEDAVYFRSRKPGQGLITVANHVSEFDPGFIPMTLRWITCLRPRLVRWTLAAEDQLFTNLASSYYFQSLKVLPVTRGGGVMQPNMLRAVDKLNGSSAWVNIFPEGRISMDHAPDEIPPLLPIKLGVGRLITECDTPPMVLPIYQEGMNVTKPPDKAPIFSRDIHVHVAVGEPIELADILEQAAAEAWDDRRTWAAIAVRIGEAFAVMREEMAVRRAASGL